jgi:hypothetical protein
MRVPDSYVAFRSLAPAPSPAKTVAVRFRTSGQDVVGRQLAHAPQQMAAYSMTSSARASS